MFIRPLQAIQQIHCICFSRAALTHLCLLAIKCNVSYLKVKYLHLPWSVDVKLSPSHLYIAFSFVAMIIVVTVWLRIVFFMLHVVVRIAKRSDNMTLHGGVSGKLSWQSSLSHQHNAALSMVIFFLFLLDYFWLPAATTQWSQCNEYGDWIFGTQCYCLFKFSFKQG